MIQNIILPKKTAVRLANIDEQIALFEMTKRIIVETIIEAADTDHEHWRITEGYQLEAINVEKTKKVSDGKN